jgi:hypothetical protein
MISYLTVIPAGTIRGNSHCAERPARYDTQERRDVINVRLFVSLDPHTTQNINGHRPERLTLSGILQSTPINRRLRSRLACLKRATSDILHREKRLFVKPRWCPRQIGTISMPGMLIGDASLSLVAVRCLRSNQSSAHVVARFRPLAQPPEVPDTAGKWALRRHDLAHKVTARLMAWMSASCPCSRR